MFLEAEGWKLEAGNYSESDQDLGFAIRNRGFSRFHGQRKQPAKASNPEDYPNIYRSWKLKCDLLICYLLIYHSLFAHLRIP